MKYDIFIGRKDLTAEGGVYLFTMEDGELPVSKGNVFPVSGFTHIAVREEHSLMAVTGMEEDRDMLYMLKADGEELSLIDRSVVPAAGDICHVDISHDGRRAVTTDFRDGAIHIADLDGEGRIKGIRRVPLRGCSVSYRQERTHPHSCFFSPDDRYLLASDLGANRVYAVSNDEDPKIVGEWCGREGIGQRHVAFLGDTVYSLAEITGDIGILKLKEDGSFIEISLKPYMKGYIPDYSAEPVGKVVLPKNYLGSADIVVSEDGSLLFASYRQTKKLAVHAIDMSGGIDDYEMLDTIGLVRSVKVSPDNRYIFALGEEMWGQHGRLEVYERTGRLSYERIYDIVLTDAFIMAVTTE